MSKCRPRLRHADYDSAARIPRDFHDAPRTRALSAKVEFCTEPFVIAGLCVRHLCLWHIAFETQAATIPMGECLFPRLFALRYTHDFEGDLAIILSNNLAFEPHT
jgi:hypothetical protein